MKILNLTQRVQAFAQVIRTSAVIGVLSLAMALAMTISSCGPMNQKPATSQAAKSNSCPSGVPLGANATPASKINYFNTNTKDYVIYADADAPVAEGDNHYQIRIVRTADLKPLSTSAVVEISYHRTSGTQTHPPFPVTDLKRQEDGTYLCTITMRKPGTWEIDISVTDDELKDTHAVQLTLQ